MSIATLAAPRRRLPAAIPVAVVAAWAVAIAAELTGRSAQLHHGALIGGGSLILGLALFLLAWQVMVVAMMLPTAIPMIRGFNVAAANQPRPKAAQLAFLAGYAAVWTEFGALAFAGDLGVHYAVDSWPWLQDHSHVIAAGSLAIAGAFQFSSLKDKCLTECRHPGAFLLRYYRRGTRAAFLLGARHGLFCAGCCWALMLVMFGAGIANLWWMAALTALMVFEKTARGGEKAVPIAGVALLASSLLVLLNPAWLPPLLGGTL
jgi:predicted metal-binding membrane protein